MHQLIQRALVLLEQSRYDLAEQELRRALAGDPHDGHAHALLAICLANQKRYDNAQREAEQAIHLTPDEAYPHFVLAIVMRQRRRYAEALAAITEALRLQPYDADYHGEQAAIFVQQEKWRDALAAAERGLAIDPDDDDCTNLKAIALVKLGRKTEAHATIEGALARAPQNATTHANQGWAYLEQGQPQQALEHFREALRLDPQSNWARQGMLQALKAQYFFYRWILAYFLWMAKLPSNARWGVMIGGYVAYRVLDAVGDANPTLGLVITPVLVAYGIFAISTWIASPLMNVLLRFNRYGKHLLTREEIITSNAVAVLVLGAIVSLISAALGSNWGITRAIAFGLSIPAVSAIYQIPQGWPRMTMMAIAGVVVLLGAMLGSVIWWVPYLPWSSPQAAVDFYRQLLAIFIFAAVGSQFAVMWLCQVVVRR